MQTSPESTDRLKGLTCSPFNGYLLYVPGQIISAASDTLPAASAEENFKPVRTVDIHVPDLHGLVRITYKLQKYKHYKSHYWRWSAERADVI